MFFFQIYDEPLKGGVFQEIKSYKPSSLVSVELDQGETLLAFLEDNNVLQIYEYKGNSWGTCEPLHISSDSQKCLA